MSNNANANNEKEYRSTKNAPNKYEVISEEEINVDPSKPCDESNPDYPWASCGIDRKPKDEEKK